MPKDLQEWLEPAKRLKRALEPDLAIPIDDPQVRRDFTALALLDPAAALDLLRTKPERLRSKQDRFGDSPNPSGPGVSFFLPGFLEIVRSSPSVLIDWLKGLDVDNGRPRIFFMGAVEAVAGHPDMLAVLLEKGRSFPKPDLIDLYTRSSLLRLQMKPLEVTDQLMHSKLLTPYYRDQILDAVVTLTADHLSVGEVRQILGAVYGSGAKVRILNLMLIQNRDDESAVADLFSLVIPNLAFAALSAVGTHDSTHLQIYQYAPAAILDLLGKVTPSRNQEGRAWSAFSSVKRLRPEQAEKMLETWPDSEWKDAVSGNAKSATSSYWRERKRLEKAEPPERAKRLEERSTEVSLHGLTSTALEGLSADERSLLFSTGVWHSMSSLGKNPHGYWSGESAFYLACVPLVKTGERIAAATDYSSSLAQESPEAAGIWLEKMPTPDERIAAVKGIIDGWCDLDVCAAAEWLATVKDPAVKQAGAQVLVEQLSGGETPMREQWKRVAERR